MSRISIKNHIQWYENNKPKYESLAEMIATTLKALLKSNNINYIDIPFRSKSVSSFQEKISRKKYNNPQEEMTDLAGIRVITYIESDVDRVCSLIKSTFNVHESESIDKATALGNDRFGYRSVHFISDIGSVRKNLPEFSPYNGLLFEIQVRTALQHAWAEIEHDRSYKFSGELPSKIKRRFHLIAGLLELADREFNEITAEIDSYSNEVQIKAEAGNLDIEINSTSLQEYLQFKLASTKNNIEVERTSIPQNVIEEIKLFGIKNINEIDKILNADFFNYFEGTKPVKTNYIGLLRDAMMLENIQHYFSECWRESWHGLGETTLEILFKKYNKSVVTSILDECEIDIYNDEFDYYSDEDEDEDGI